MKRTASSVTARLHRTGAEATNGETSESFGTKGRVRVRRGLVALPVALAVMVPVAPALASTTGTSGYKQEVPVKTEPKSGTAPSKEATTPASTTPKTSPAPTTATAPAKAVTSPSKSTLPFTGLDLRWVLGAGLLLLACGLSIRLAQRRQRHSGR
jgi:hypothetical protein